MLRSRIVPRAKYLKTDKKEKFFNLQNANSSRIPGNEKMTMEKVKAA